MIDAHRCLVLLVGATVSAAILAAEKKDASPHIVIARSDGTHAAAQLPLSNSDLRDARHIWAWTDRLPPRMLERRELPLTRENIVEELGPSPARSLDVRVRGWSRPKELASVRIIAAPEEMWRTVPEPLLPMFPVSREGRVTIPARGAMRIRAAGTDLGTMWERVDSSAKSADLALRPAADARVQLQSSDGSPVVRAFATALTVHRGSPKPVLRAQFAFDDRATLRIPALPRSEAITLVVIAKGAAPRTITGTAAELSRTVRLVPAAAVRGTFVDEDGKPLPGVHVEAEAWIAPDASAISGDRVVSDDEGRWFVGNLPRTHAVVRAATKGRGTFRKEVSLDGDEVDLGTIALLPSSDVMLEVADEERRAIAGVVVATDSGFKGETDDEGRVAISELPPDQPAAVTLSAKGFAKQIIHLTPPLPQRERVTLERAFTVTGRIVDDSGSAAANVMAIVTIGTSYRPRSIDPDGVFSFDVEAGKDFELTFESPTAASLKRKEESGRPGEVRDLGTIRLPSGMVVRGRTVDSAGAPVAGARVWVLRPNPAGAVASWVAGRMAQATSDMDGAFELRGLTAGPFVMRIDAADFARAHRNGAIESSPLDLGEIEIVRGSTVTVRAPHDDALTARIDLRGQWIDADMLTAPVIDGHAHLRNVPPGQYRVTVLSERTVVCERDVEVKEETAASVECPPPVIVRGRVLLDGTPAYAGSLTWSRPAETDALIDTSLSPLGARQQRVFGASGGTISVPVTTDGTFETDLLRAGGWQVSWRSGEGAGTAERPLSIPDVSVAHVIVEFAGGVIRGRVLDAGGVPVAGARIREIGGPLFAMATSAGTFTMTGVSAGNHRLQAALGARASRIIEVPVESGRQMPEVIFELDDTERNVLSVRVIGADEQPKPNAFVFAEGAGTLKILTADANGVARGAFPEGLPEGARLIAFADNTWAFTRLRRSGGENDPQSTTVRFGATGALMIRSRTVSGEPSLLSSGAGDLSWMLMRIGTDLSVSPDAPAVVHGLPPGLYEVRLGASAATASVRAGSTATVDLP